MKPAEFEEREYEAPLYNQLERSVTMLWSPGQVLEGLIGIDRASMVHDLEFFWRTIGLSRIPRGAVLSRYVWPFSWGPRSSQQQLPNFRLNLFLQAKRSHFSSRTPKAMKAMGLQGPMWAFFIDEGQQRLLEYLSKRVKGRAHVAYAAPVFHEKRHLFLHTRARTIVANSTFPSVIRLRGHKGWYYQRQGAVGVANPDPELIEEPSLIQRLQHMINEDALRPVIDELPLESLAEHVIAAVGNQRLPESFLRAQFFDELQEIDRLSEQFNLVPTARAYMQVSLFADTFALVWLVVSG